MTNNVVVKIASMEESDIDRDRIVNGDQVPEEYFCPICQYLLWKPRSCSSCQHLFCEKCIRTWIENPTSANRCPFRCTSYEERRCPPYVQSLLSHLNIHCRNSSFGCTGIIPYEQLEYHESVQCKYLSQRCSECDQLVLISQLDNHQQSPGLCIPHPIRCTICENYIEKIDFRKHFHECCQKRITALFERVPANGTIQITTTNDQPIAPNNGLAFFQAMVNKIQLFEQQKQMSRLPTSLKGVDAVRRVREQNPNIFYHILIMLKFILMNWSKIPFFLFSFSIGGFLAIAILIIGGYSTFCNWAYKHIHVGTFLIILLSYMSSYSTSFICQSISDTTIIFCFGLFTFLWGCSSRALLELLEVSPLFNSTKLSLLACFLGLLAMKIILLFIRLYYWLFPIYIAGGLITVCNFYLAFKIHRIYATTIVTTNQPIMTV